MRSKGHTPDSALDSLLIAPQISKKKSESVAIQFLPPYGRCMSGKRKTARTRLELEEASKLKELWLRKKKFDGLTQRDLGSLLGCTQGNITQYLNGHLSLSDATLLKFAYHLGFNPEEIRPGFYDQNPELADGYGVISKKGAAEQPPLRPIVAPKHRGEKLALALGQSDRSSASFARTMGVSPQDVNNWFSRGIPAKYSFKAGKALEVDPEWLALDDEELAALDAMEHQADEAVTTERLSLGSVLNDWRLSQGLSATQLAHKAGMQQPTVHRILAEKSLEPRRSSIEKLAQAMGYTCEDVYRASLGSGGDMRPEGSLANRIRDARKALGLGQGDLALRLNVKQQTISKLESGKSKATYIASDLADALEVDLQWLLTGKKGRLLSSASGVRPNLASIKEASKTLTDAEKAQLIEFLAKSLRN